MSIVTDGFVRDPIGGSGSSGGLSGAPLTFTAPVAGDQATYNFASAAVTISTIRVKLVGGTSCSVQVVRNINGSNLNLLAAALSNASPGTWVATSTLQNNVLASGDDLTVQIVTAVGNPTEIDVLLS